VLWSRERENIIRYDIAGPIPLNQKPLLTPFDMRGQRPIRKAKPRSRRSVLIDRINNPGSIGPPHAAHPREHEHGFTNANRRIRRESLEPTKLKLPPIAKRTLCTVKHVLATTKLNARVIDRKAVRHRCLPERRTDRIVRQIKCRLDRQNAAQSVDRRFAKRKYVAEPQVKAVRGEINSCALPRIVRKEDNDLILSANRPLTKPPKASHPYAR